MHAISRGIAFFFRGDILIRGAAICRKRNCPRCCGKRLPASGVGLGGLQAFPPARLRVSYCLEMSLSSWCHSGYVGVSLELPCCLIGLGLLRLLACSGFLSSIVLRMRLAVRLFVGWCHFMVLPLRVCGIPIVTVICSVVVLSEVLRLFLESWCSSTLWRGFLGYSWLRMLELVLMNSLRVGVGVIFGLILAVPRAASLGSLLPCLYYDTILLKNDEPAVFLLLSGALDVFSVQLFGISLKRSSPGWGLWQSGASSVLLDRCNPGAPCGDFAGCLRMVSSAILVKLDYRAVAHCPWPEGRIRMHDK
ncbi:hypothetical protein Nepgr_015792 [Nepenthes gracilis]|uniref:Uncharacterized protein n=1 Tax=Nepenthes gracilis TaxID=150966 RepID=A0AAD3XRM1_NEPGR|nr:hypothetical protein Nepgr_015792 [Nepenthes gracilis]